MWGEVTFSCLSTDLKEYNNKSHKVLAKQHHRHGAEQPGTETNDCLDYLLIWQLFFDESFSLRHESQAQITSEATGPVEHSVENINLTAEI